MSADLKDTKQTDARSFHRDFACILLILMLVLTALSLYRPQLAHPDKALTITFGILAVFVGSLILFLYQPALWFNRSVLVVISVFGLFLFWSLFKCYDAPVPALGKRHFGTLLVGFWTLFSMYLLSVLTGISDDRATDEKVFPLLSLSLFFVIAATFLSLYALYQYLWGFEIQYREMNAFLPEEGSLITEGIRHALREKRVVATLGAPNIFAAFLAIAAPFFLALIAGGKRAIWRVLGVAGFIALLVAVYLTRSRGGILSLALALVLTLVLFAGQGAFRRSTKIAVMVVGLGIFAYCVLMHPHPTRAAYTTPTATMQKRSLDSWTRRLQAKSTILQRVYYIKSGWEIIKQRPILGNGLAGFALFYPRYKIEAAGETQFAHNFIVQVWSEQGLAGLVMLLVLLGGIVLCAARGAMRAKQKTIHYIRLACLAALLTFMFNSLFEYSFYSREMFLAFCLIAGCAISGREQSRALSSKFKMLRFPLILIISAGAVVCALVFLWKPALGQYFKFYANDSVEAGDYSSALVQYQKAAAMQPDNPWYRAGVGQTFLSLGRFEEGGEHLKKAIALHPYSASLKSSLASYYQTIMKFPEAIRLVREAINLYPTHHHYHFQLGQLLYMTGKTEEARAELERALELCRYRPQQEEIETYIRHLHN